MFSDKAFAFALKVGSMSWRRIRTACSYKKKKLIETGQKLSLGKKF